MIQELYWKLLIKSGVFKYWYTRHITTLLYELEINDIEPLKEKLLKRYEKGKTL